jgi:hypothetical protein
MRSLRRRLVVGLAAAICTLPFACGDDGERRPTPPMSPPPAPVVAGDATGAAAETARPVARRFLTAYLALLYGRGRADAPPHASASVRRSLARGRARVPPAARRRGPRVARLELVAQARDVVVATAQIEDGGVSAYPLTFALVRRGGQWTVNALGND